MELPFGKTFLPIIAHHLFILHFTQSTFSMNSFIFFQKNYLFFLFHIHLFNFILIIFCFYDFKQNTIMFTPIIVKSLFKFVFTQWSMHTYTIHVKTCLKDTHYTWLNLFWKPLYSCIDCFLSSWDIIFSYCFLLFLILHFWSFIYISNPIQFLWNYPNQNWLQIL